MIVKGVLSPLLSLALMGSQPAHTPTLTELPWGAIVLVECREGSGTAFHIGNGRYITAAHVAAIGGCSIGGEPSRTVVEDGELDMAEMTGPSFRPKFDIDCGGFKVNRHYLAIGYAAGRFRLNIPLIYSAFGRDPLNGTGQFVGADVIPGMSGGPLVNEAFRVSGIVNQRWPSRSRSLGDTYLCRR